MTVSVLSLPFLNPLLWPNGIVKHPLTHASEAWSQGILLTNWTIFEYYEFRHATQLTYYIQTLRSRKSMQFVTQSRILSLLVIVFSMNRLLED